MSEASNKAIVARLVDEVLNDGRIDVIDELYPPELAPAAKRWITPFREAFPDVHMDIVDLIAEGDKVVGRFTCTGTHLGSWRGHPPTHRRFTRVPEVYIFTIRHGKITHAWGLEDTHRRMTQLGLVPAQTERNGTDRSRPGLAVATHATGTHARAAGGD